MSRDVKENVWLEKQKQGQEGMFLTEKVISHLQRKILFSSLGNFANGEEEISRRWEYPFCSILPLPRAPLEKKSARHGNVTAMVLFEQMMMLIYFQQFSVLD